MIDAEYVPADTQLPVRLSRRERDLIIERVFLSPEMEAELRKAGTVGSKLEVNLTLADIDDLLGCIAAEANHCTDGKVQRLLDGTCDRLGSSSTTSPTSRPLGSSRSNRQSRGSLPSRVSILAFIHYYTKINGIAPAEADLRKYFRVSPPVVRTMVVTLDRLGLIARTPGQARSIQLKISRAEIPDLL